MAEGRQTTYAAIDVTRPPLVAAAGRGLHGVRQLVDDFVLPQLWQLHLYSYAADLQVGGTRHQIEPGSVSLVPPATPVRYRYRGPSNHLYAHLEAAFIHPVDAAATEVMISAGAELPALTDLMSSAIASAASRPERTQADIWMVLLRLAERDRARTAAAGRVENSPASSYVAAAMSYVESHLTERITVPALARSMGITADHLTRVFSAQTGQTVTGYVRRRRVEHAQRLLTNTTMSVSAIAATVGIPDLQAFNKTCRAVTGRSPRQLRQPLVE
ncbi:AraC family transcriptional regulator [Luteipulveratus mongoliensis]|uniref:HTH araC/xylS-type domain-containing protein n=1 Tax=Luteipulveratus mongoliensis TaxID=571913 RepID=A0A0K1JP19_9MICO|nr:AraC family transcriptional regulator [Luteipulveratus mongoliensis]AKU18315.1 hypothetical protein VV02_24840 [Luteipulveratus mongoliensis]